ncbi:orotidine-5'-phosphate decarboxylase [Desulfovibrio legallii]|jgi:orotidine-5'-phosphate decarboxylase|uniref:Orotidine 5'-phosphate decarboxylase n=1 Tax=Desulfovibrio legallii TaxID=571438 RepID=A0A1G7HYZ3_9BACT|nr:orotidine-5'-phosphate decarboxylase [Desulfovibrio legallii]SDF05354.1 orotidine-5'-phosphate decarboxylase [Desulfovibrio legallii]
MPLTRIPPRPDLVVALDLPDKDRALSLARRLRGVAPWCKVGMELFTLAGPALLESLRGLGFNVFLDLKFYDIPHTVAQAVKAAAAGGADLLTLHCQGGERMCRAAREAAAGLPGGGPLLFGVTVLTSFAQGEMPGIVAAPQDFALSLARGAAAWGLDGVVCSGHEVPEIKKACPGLRCLCPGIRPEGAAADDQRRVMTPAMAVAAGADYLVAGRPIIAAPDPAEAARAMAAAIRHAALRAQGVPPAAHSPA